MFSLVSRILCLYLFVSGSISKAIERHRCQWWWRYNDNDSYNNNNDNNMTMTMTTTTTTTLHFQWPLLRNVSFNKVWNLSKLHFHHNDIFRNGVCGCGGGAWIFHLIGQFSSILFFAFPHLNFAPPNYLPKNGELSLSLPFYWVIRHACCEKYLNAKTHEKT